MNLVLRTLRPLNPKPRTAKPARVCFLWPLFARAPCHRFLEFFLLSSPGVQSAFFLRLVGRCDLSAGPEQTKTPPPRVLFFFALAPCRRPTGLLLPLPFAGAGAKKKTPWVVFFCFWLWPRRKVAAPNGGNKKKTLHTRRGQPTKF